MKYRLLLVDEDNNEYVGQTVYSTFSKAMRAMDEDLETESFIGDKRIVAERIIHDDEE